MKKKILIALTAILSVIIITLIAAGCYFFHVAQVRSKKDFVNSEPIAKTNPIYPERESFLKAKKEKWYLTSNDGLKLDAYYLSAEKKTDKTVIVAHGFANSKEGMAQYAWLFHELGYNVLVPDDRAHGESEGDLIGFGWKDKDDYVKWIQQVIEKNGKNEKIALFGLSMGAATVMMTSGENLPENVKAIIEDCGYDTVWNELVYQAKDMYNLPAFPILYEVSFISQLRAGWNYKEASSITQLAKNKRPMLFIHGDKDDFVPTSMVYKNYEATKGEKELLIVKGAKHAESFQTDKKLYKESIEKFLSKYFD
ncbi:hypothetical protein SAMN02745116_00917 [Pilibacter termitis]|uniref:Serine aminopeptidase S33 domain-containing protein n=1 Tax=Pilibacter termitis TaxID=263852 RepID=A0A1T4M434_9ENTE|nr:alpha/beta hydrolase [Pilibacter termitis]SJZ61616.1 hypothetical protein SAMN02745116_00917 [Pilibacter termitis]